MMITGRQIREARQMLGWSLATLAAHAEIPEVAIARAEGIDDTPGIMLEQGRRLQTVFEQAGIGLIEGAGVIRVEAIPRPVP
ncbi:hypothetical protein P7D22_11880 [Lichenihabitans sp. Uapishka_5]|uniref:hypothetical protein n=1 Tax=Lichenihabitans sp. Uapishka_5 TaxID=3037302 RepID=UPI0029E82864|nr:hypothetical protein [Lichenihabitans sp. Uapishka_5]MDX7951869.1 hypothetical protein [Lichenihabitans sp. Uapishka_5]